MVTVMRAKEFTLTELLRAYPEAEARVVEDSMLEHVERIKDNALAKVVPNRVVLPDPQILVARVTSLSEELASSDHGSTYTCISE